MESGEVTDVCVRSLSAMMSKAAPQMLKDTTGSGLEDGKKRFLVGWSHLISANAEWMFVQLYAGILSPAEIVEVASLHIDVARTYLATQRAPQPVS